MEISQIGHIHQRLLELKFLGILDGMWMEVEENSRIAEMPCDREELDKLRAAIKKMLAGYAEVGRDVHRLSFVFDQGVLLVGASHNTCIGTLVRNRNDIAKVDSLIFECLESIDHRPVELSSQAAIMAKRLLSQDQDSSTQEEPCAETSVAPLSVAPAEESGRTISLLEESQEHIAPELATNESVMSLTTAETPLEEPSPSSAKLSQATALWPHFLKGLEELLSKPFGEFEAKALIHDAAQKLPGSYVPGPSEYIAFAERAMRPLNDPKQRNQAMDAVYDLVFRLIGAS